MAQVIINKNDTVEFLESEELAEKYAVEVQRLMDTDGVTVELGEPRGMAGYEIVADDDEDTNEITDIYQWAADRAVNDWSWAE